MSLEPNGSPYGFSVGYVSGNDKQYLAEVLEADTNPSTLNPFGYVSFGSITLAGVLILDCTVEEGRHISGLPLGGWRYVFASPDSPLFRVSFQLEDENQIITTRRALRHEQHTETSFPVILLPLFVVPAMSLPETLPPILAVPSGVDGLLLGRSTSHLGAFERLGTFTNLPPKVFEEARREHGVRQIILV
jgi:hypothetical protein